jgi:DNA processing protein
MAHKGAIEGGGKTIAVLGCGVNVCYPPENNRLRAEIIKNGCILSEYPPWVSPKPYHFPARNRIISGLSHAVIVTEAAAKSGTLITVDTAQEQGREVMAVPGNITTRLCEGTNALIRDGAVPVTKYTDILPFLPNPVSKSDTENITNTSAAQKNDENSLAPDEKRVYDSLTFEPTGFDALLAQANATPASLHYICTKLELAGLIKKLPGLRFIKNS